MTRPTTGRPRPPGEVWMLLKDRKLLARLMAIQHYSQRALARDSGFATHSYLGRLIAGTATSCTADRAVAIAACLQVPLDSLFVANVSRSAGRSVTEDGPRPFPRTAAARRRNAARAVSAASASGGKQTEPAAGDRVPA